MSRGVLPVLALCLALPALAGDFEGHVRGWLGPGFDSNAKRDYVSPGTTPLWSPFTFGLVQLDGSLLLGDSVQLLGAYDVGGRLFPFLMSESTLLQSAQLDAVWAVHRMVALGLVGRARDRRGAERDYTDLQGGASVDFTPDRALDVKLEVVAHRFLFWNRFSTSYWGPDSTFSVRYRFLKKHAVSAFWTFNPRTYNGGAYGRPDDTGSLPPLNVIRQDTVTIAGLSWAYRGPFHLSAGYSFFSEASNSYGESLMRHRLSVTAGVALPWQLTVLATGALQLTTFPDGVYLSPELTVLEEDENSSSATLKVVRALGQHVELDLRYAFYFNVLPNNGFVYARHVVTFGVAFTY